CSDHSGGCTPCPNTATGQAQDCSKGYCSPTACLNSGQSGCGSGSACCAGEVCTQNVCCLAATPLYCTATSTCRQCCSNSDCAGNAASPCCNSGTCGAGSCGGTPSACVLPSPPVYNVLVRANRRGEINAANSFYVNPSVGPGDNNGALSWGPAYDTGNSQTDTGSLYFDDTALQGGNPTLVPMHNSTMVGYYSRTGSPAVGGYVQLADPTSWPQLILSQAPNTNSHYTGQIVIPNITGPNSGAVPPPANWQVNVASGVYQTTFLSPTFLLAATTTLFQILTPSYDVTPLGPPEPCNSSPCDTDQQTNT